MKGVILKILITQTQKISIVIFVTVDIRSDCYCFLFDGKICDGVADDSNSRVLFMCHATMAEILTINGSNVFFLGDRSVGIGIGHDGSTENILCIRTMFYVRHISVRKIGVRSDGIIFINIMGGHIDEH